METSVVIVNRECRFGAATKGSGVFAAMPSKAKTIRRRAPLGPVPAAATSRVTRAAIWALLLASFWAFSFQRISFRTTANDLGRHLRDGELLLRKTTAILHANFYSYTY